MEEYLYHFVPKNMQGNILYPLNQLKDTKPKIYEEEIKKYIDREKLLTKEIPVLNCLWNDVIHLTAVHPKKLTEALKKVGINPKNDLRCYQIPVNMVMGNNVITYLYLDNDTSPEGNKKNYETFILDHMEKYSKITDKTLDYYKECNEQGKKPLLFHLIPHILYKGIVDISELKIVNEND